MGNGRLYRSTSCMKTVHMERLEKLKAHFLEQILAAFIFRIE
jgi:hypothetical protein